MMATPINQKEHVETCSMKHEGQEISITGTFEEVRVEPGYGADPFAVPRPTRCVIAHVASDGARQELAIDGSALVQLRLLLDRMYAIHERGIMGAPVGAVIPKGRH